MQSSLSTGVGCSNALPFNLSLFPGRDYPAKLTHREILSEEELSEHLDCLSEYQQEYIWKRRSAKKEKPRDRAAVLS